MRYHGQMNAPAPADLLTEREAAERIGWTAANLRSHRERHELALLAERLPEDMAAAVRQLGGDPPARQARRLHALQNLPDLSGPPWALTTEGPPAFQKLNARGLEVARVLHYGRRPTEPPPHVWTELGVRYREADLVAWLDRHPAAQERGRWLTEQQVSDMLELELSTLKTLRYRARLAAEELEGMSRAKGKRKGETAEEFQTRRARIAHLERQIDALPVGHKVGRVYRYRPEDVAAWQERHPDRGPHPLLRERDEKRGPLLTSEDLAEALRFQSQSIVGYRCRAGAAARKLATLPKGTRRRPGETAEQRDERLALRRQLERLADCIPPHVLVDGRPMYQRADVREWQRRQRRREKADAAE